MNFFITLVTLCVFASGRGASIQTSLDSILGVQGLFPMGQERSSDIVGQLQSLLADPSILNETYSQYKKMFNTNDRGSAEIFAQKLVTIAEHNLGGHQWSMGVNQFSDMKFEDFLSYYTGYAESEVPQAENDMIAPKIIVTAPESLNWTAKGIVTPIKNQKKCGSCITFATAGVVESAYARANPKAELLDLSEQELLDCTMQNRGCSGGQYKPAFTEVKNHGLSSEKDYPYEAKQHGFFGFGDCQRNKSPQKNRAIPPIANWGTCQTSEKDENIIKEAVANYGPVAVVVEVTKEFQDYKSGIFTTTTCNNSPNHAIMMVGYGSQRGQDFWYIKNSWATTWGESGFMRFARNQNNLCSIANQCFFVTV